MEQLVKQLIAVCTMMLLSNGAVYAEADNQSDWKFRLTPYAWFPGFEGDVSTIPGTSSVPIKLSPNEVLSDARLALALVFEAKKGRNGLLVDASYSDLRSNDTLHQFRDGTGLADLELESITKTTLFSATYLRELYRKEQTVLDVFVGARYWRIGSTLNFSGGLGYLAAQDISNVESWVDPLIGIKGRTSFGQTRFFAAGGAAIGGFGVGSDLFYDVTANIGYQWNDAIGTTVGYRLFDLDYEEDDFLYDVTQHGWIIGLTWAF